MKISVALALGVAVYATITTLVVFWRGINIVTKMAARIYNLLHFLVPVVLILACYLSMMIAVRYNKRRLASNKHNTAAVTTQVMDQATRAMLAVFISNLLLGLPHSIYHILPYDFSILSYVLVHIVFYTHLIVDPLAFLCSNLRHRQRLLQAFTYCLTFCRINKPSHATSTLPLHITPQTSSQEQAQQEEEAKK